MKTDVGDIPARVPRKKRALERWPDVWIAQHLARDDLDAGDRERLEAVKAGRKARPAVVLGVLSGREGLTPKQRAVWKRLGTELEPTTVMKSTDADTSMLNHIVRESTHVFAFPRQTYEPTQKADPVWLAIRYTRHRRVPCTVVLPNGTVRSPDERG